MSIRITRRTCETTHNTTYLSYTPLHNGTYETTHNTTNVGDAPFNEELVKQPIAQSGYHSYLCGNAFRCVGKKICVFGCICKYLHIHTKYQIHALLRFPIQIHIHKRYICKYISDSNYLLTRTSEISSPNSFRATCNM